MMLSDPEVESAVLISSDEGASFEKHPISFTILSLLFHPAQENWILAYSHDGKVATRSIQLTQVHVCYFSCAVIVNNPPHPPPPQSFNTDDEWPNFISQLYSSMDFGRKWQLVHDNVMLGRFYWYGHVAPISDLFAAVIDSPFA